MSTYKTSESPYKSNNTASNMAGVTLMNNQIGSVVAQVMAACVAGGHVLLTGPPGVAKTLLARTIAKTLGVRFTRAQVTQLRTAASGAPLLEQPIEIHNNTFDRTLPIRQNDVFLLTLKKQ